MKNKFAKFVKNAVSSIRFCLDALNLMPVYKLPPIEENKTFHA